MTHAQLQKLLTAADPAAVLVSPRVLERVIQEVCHLKGFFWTVPHRKSFVVDRHVLFRFVEQDDLVIEGHQPLPVTVILLARSRAEDLTSGRVESALLKYWRRLFHANVHLVLEDRRSQGLLPDATIQSRIETIGLTEFEEIRSVLVKDNYLNRPADDSEVYIEFIAVFLELQYFSPNLLNTYFPAIGDFAPCHRLVAKDLDAESLFNRTRLEGAPEPSVKVEDHSLYESHEYFWKLKKSADKAEEAGNMVKAAINRTKAARVAPAELSPTVKASAEGALSDITTRLKEPLYLDDQAAQDLLTDLLKLLQKADQGQHPVEARILYDLQDICIDHEREIYALDAVEWVLSVGRRPIKRPLPSQRIVLIIRHLRNALAKLTVARLTDADRGHTSEILVRALEEVEERLRDRFRPVLSSVCEDVGLSPRNSPERIAFQKMIEEILDRILDTGFLTFSDLRDTISRNQLKMPDLEDPQEFIRGDALRRLDRRLATLLDGVYRPSEIYMRWMEQFTSLGFGTRLGRVLTKYIAFPFGLAFITLMTAALLGDHFLHTKDHKIGPGQLIAQNVASSAMGTLEGPPPNSNLRAKQLYWSGTSALLIAAEGTEASKAAPLAAQAAAHPTLGPSGPLAWAAPILIAAQIRNILAIPPPTDEWLPPELVEHPEPTSQWMSGSWTLLISAIVLGVFYLGLLNSRKFRDTCAQFGLAILKALHKLLIAAPLRLVQAPWVERLTQSWTFQLSFWYVIRPAFLCAPLVFFFPALVGQQLWAGVLMFLAMSVFFNSQTGLALTQTFGQFMLRLYRNIRSGLLIGLYQWIVDVFHKLLQGVEIVLFSVDEWLRFRKGDTQLSLAVRTLFSALWFPVGFLTRFFMVVLIEPMLNPLKLPICFIAAKIMYPLMLGNASPDWWQVFRDRDITPLLASFNSYIEAVQQVLIFYPLAAAFVLVTAFLLPNLFGFLFWEIKENWSLYRANRAKSLQPVQIGHHGETLRGFLQPGFHSGTIPILLDKLRTAERHAQSSGNWRSVRSARQQIEEVEAAIRRFVKREMVSLLHMSSPWSYKPLEVGEIRIASNRIEIELKHESHPESPARLRFDSRHDWLIGELSELGFLRLIHPEPVWFFVASLAVLYKLAGVDFVRQQIEHNLPEQSVSHRVVPEGIRVFSSPQKKTGLLDNSVLYDCKKAGGQLIPTKENGEPHLDWPAIDAPKLFFRELSLGWERLVEVWSEKERCPKTVKAMTREFEIIPQRYLQETRVMTDNLAPEPALMGGADE
ncbi:MAG: hypothetical protein ACFCD0_07665 [Gemmataceae bacterium]